MNRQVAYVLVAAFAALLFFLAVGYRSWKCPDSLLSPLCIKDEVNKVTGILLITAGLLVFFAAIALILVMVMRETWAEYLSAALTAISAILAVAGVFHYVSNNSFWCPIIATFGMSLTIALAIILIFDIFTGFQ